MDSTSRKIALDTDILVDFLRGHKAAVHAIKRLSEEGSNLATNEKWRTFARLEIRVIIWMIGLVGWMVR